MATLTINIPDAVVADVINAVAMKGNWTAETGLTKAQFAKKRVADWVKSEYQTYEGTLAATTAAQSSNTQTGQIIID